MIVPIVVQLCFTFSCQNQGEKGVTQNEAKAITDQVLKIWNVGDLVLTDGLYDPGYVRHHPTPSVNASLDDFKDTVVSNRSVFPDYKLMFDEMIIKGDRIITLATVTGTNTMPREDGPATGRKIHISGIYIYRIARGKVIEEWTYFNLLSYYQQLGYTLNPPRAEEAPEKKM